VRALAIAVGLIFAIAGGIAAFLAAVAQGGFSTRDRPGAAEAFVAAAVRDWSIPKRYRSMVSPVACSDAVIDEARAHWADHCATCHANNGGGDTMFGRAMYPKPPDMRATATQRQSDGALYYTIKSGVRLSGMPAFGEPGDNDGDSWKLVCFVRHLPRVDAEEERRMKSLNPKTPDELEEEQEEDRFLNGGAAPPPSEHHHH
jgi:mono/diheme cytochrome c family protein